LRSILKNSRKFLITLILFLFASQSLQAAQVLIAGDSWAKPMVQQLEQIFNEKGHDVVVGEWYRWLRTRNLSKPAGLNWIVEWLDDNPDASIVHLSIGINDWLYVWQPEWAETSIEDERFAEVITDVETITDHILSIRPDLKILWSSYDYFRPFEDKTPTELNAAQQRMNDLSRKLAASIPGLSFVNLNGTLQLTFGFDGVAHTEFDPSNPIPAGDPSLPDPTLPGPFQVFLPGDLEHLTEAGWEAIARKQYGLFYADALSDQPFQINSGLNDAWYNPETAGQGFIISVFPEISQVFMAWFTYDVERPDDSVTANLGEPGHRWLTAQGPYVDNQAVLEVWNTVGGIFDSAVPTPFSEKDGEIIIEFTDCNAATLTYDIPSVDKQNTLLIQRVTQDNVALCELLTE
jgi:hypothetical protein